MQIEIKMEALDNGIIDYNYLYPMASMLKTVLSEARPELAQDLYQGVHKEKIKLFTFSPLSSFPNPKSVQIDGEKQKKMLLGKRSWFRIASPWPELLNTIGQALLNSPKIRIMNKEFRITTINMIAPPEFTESMVWRPFGQAASIATPWSIKDNKRKEFIYPDTKSSDGKTCAELINNNLLNKFRRLKTIRNDIAAAWLKDSSITDIDRDITTIQTDFLHLDKERTYRTLMQKNKTSYIRSWRCPIKISAPIPIQKLIWATGIGALNSQGYGLVQEGKK